MIRDVDQLEAHVMPSPQGFREPTLSPDGHWIVYETPTELRKIAVTGGPSIALCTCDVRPGSLGWSDDGL